MPEETRKRMSRALKGRKCPIRLKPNLQISEDLAYILGVLKGDGCACLIKREVPTILNTGRVDLIVSSKTFALSFSSALQNIGLHPNFYLTRRKGWKKQAYCTSAYSKTLVEWYKALTFSDIECLLTENQVYMCAFVRGFYESDGSVYKPKYERGICRFYRFLLFNTDEALIDLVQRLLQKLGITCHKYNGINKKNIVGKETRFFRLQIHRKQSCLKFIPLIKPCIKEKPKSCI